MYDEYYQPLEFKWDSETWDNNLIEYAVSIAPVETTTDLIVWAWHGDYLNLGAGAEIGIYFRPTNEISNPEGLDHYFAHPDFTLPMQLYLYNYEGENSIENILMAV